MVMRIACVGLMLAAAASGAFAEVNWKLGEKQRLESESPFAVQPEALFDTSFFVTDWDGDGLIDVLAVNVHETRKYYCAVVLFRNVGTKEVPKFGKRVILYDNARSHNIVAAHDFDGDGKKDLMLTREGVTVLYNRGTPGEPKWERKEIVDRQVPTIPGLGLNVVDFDGDGKVDLVAGQTHHKAVYLWKNTGTPEAPAFGEPTEVNLGEKFKPMEPSPALADLDGDGDLDMVVSCYSGVVLVAENLAGKGKGPEFAPPVPLKDPEGPIKMYGRLTVVQLADMNSDGVPDLLFMGEGRRDQIWIWYGKKD